MTSFQFWQNLMPEGRFLCMLCFEGKSIEREAYVDDQGDHWDICKACQAEDEEWAKIKRNRALQNDD